MFSLVYFIYWYFQMKVNIMFDKGWKIEDLYVFFGFYIDVEIIGNDKKFYGEIGVQLFVYLMGVGGFMMNGCFGRNYQLGDLCYVVKRKIIICLVRML